MVLEWFSKDEFAKFHRRVERLQKFLILSNKEMSLDQFVELRRHFKQMKTILPELIRLYDDELKTISLIPDSEYKKALENLSNNLKKKLDGLDSWINNAQALVEEVLAIRVLTRVSEQKRKLERIITYLSNLLTNAQKDFYGLTELEKNWKAAIKIAHSKPIARIPIMGKLSNGWQLSKIRDVIIDLGGEVIKNPNPGGRHPYLIKFSGERKIPLGESTPPYELIKEVSYTTGIKNNVLAESFNRGHLVAAA